MMGGGLALIRDRELGIIEGHLVTTVKRSSTILGIIGSGTVKALLAGTIIFGVDLLVTGIVIRNTEDYLLVLAVLFIISVGITSLVIALSSRYTNQQTYASSIAFLDMILFMTSGAFYPILGMPDWLRWITVINPESYAVHALRALILRADPSQPGNGGDLRRSARARALLRRGDPARDHDIPPDPRVRKIWGYDSRLASAASTIAPSASTPKRSEFSTRSYGRRSSISMP